MEKIGIGSRRPRWGRISFGYMLIINRKPLRGQRHD